MNTQRFTLRSQETLQEMQNLAQENGHQEIKDLHLLAATLYSNRDSYISGLLVILSRPEI